MKQISIIEAKNKTIQSTNESIAKIINVCGYARVSTEKDEQFSSFTSQVQYYTEYIQQHKEWNFVGVFTDEGVTGTSMKKRLGFQKMISEAMNGNIDLIVTKSLSRFARNTVDTLLTIRKLKEHGCECFFEKENINTADSKGEFLITIMSSIAQEESRSISANVLWGIRASMEKGITHVPFKHFLGYDKGPDGQFIVNEDEALIVRSIYYRFLSGKSVGLIAKELMNEGIPSPYGNKIWYRSTILSILQNEKYKGDALLQKTYTDDYLSKTKKKNRGERTQYYITNHHPAIVNNDVFEKVATRIAESHVNDTAWWHKNLKNINIYSKLHCPYCGHFYTKKRIHQGKDTFYYVCVGKIKGKCKQGFVIYKDDIDTAFENEKIQLLCNTDYVKQLVETALEQLDTEYLEKERDELLSSNSTDYSLQRQTQLNNEIKQIFLIKNQLMEALTSPSMCDPIFLIFLLHMDVYDNNAFKANWKT